jgi:hypothetical protein
MQNLIGAFLIEDKNLTPIRVASRETQPCRKRKNRKTFLGSPLTRYTASPLSGFPSVSFLYRPHFSSRTAEIFLQNENAKITAADFFRDSKRRIGLGLPDFTSPVHSFSKPS